MKQDFLQAHSTMASDLVNDIFHSNISNRGKAGLIRQYAELLARFLFKINDDEMVMLGDKKVKRGLAMLREQSPYHGGIAGAFEYIRDLGNLATHTNYGVEITDKEINKSIFCLGRIYACFFVDYFTKYQFGSNAAAMSMFCLLPPRFRLLVLINLHRRSQNNYDVAEKMITVMFKVRGIERMKVWVDRNQSKLESIAKQFAHCGEKEVWDIIKKGYSAYDFALAKMGATFRPSPYENFEKSAERYRDYVFEMSVFQSDEVLELKVLMDFVFVGVK